MSARHASASARRRAAWFSAGALLLLLAAIAIGIHQKTQRAMAPPIYDAMSYYIKAAEFWRSVATGRLPNPLNVEPVVRPPGTILLSGPLGFSADFRPFFFRSIFVPVLLAVAACWIVLRDRIRRPREYWLATGACAAVAALPAFYHFEFSDIMPVAAYWGLVDAFFASVAALATALLVVGARRRRLGPTTLGAAAAALTLLIKPAAVVVVPLILWTWLVEVIAAHWPVARAWREDARFRRYIVTSAAIVALLVGATAVACVRSRYLSEATLQFFGTSQRLLAEMYRDASLLPLIVQGVQPWFGWHWVVLYAVAIIVLAGRLVARALSHGIGRDHVRLAAALAAFGAGVFWWIAFAGPSEMRYVAPFALIFLVATVPDVLPRGATWPAAAHVVGAIALAAPALLLVGLLWADRPPPALQRALGVTLAAGQFGDEVRVGDLLARAARTAGRDLALYTLETDALHGMVGAVGEYHRLVEPRAPSFRTLHPIDWTRAPLIRRHELLSSDYVLFRPMRDAAERARWVAQAHVDGFGAETEVMRAWLTEVPPHDGFEVVSDGPLRLLRIADVDAADRAFSSLVARHQWRPLFRSANTASLLVSDADLARASIGSVPGTRDVEFTGKFRLHGATMTEVSGALEMELVWQSLSAEPSDWWVLVHVLDARGRIVSQADYRLLGALRPGLSWRDKVTWSRDQLRGVDRLAVGIYRRSGGMLEADRGRRDWNNQRLLIFIPRLAGG